MNNSSHLHPYLLSVAVLKHDQMSLGQESVYMDYRLQPITEGSQDRRLKKIMPGGWRDGSVVKSIA